MFFVALSFERGPKRWDPDCRHFPRVSFSSGAAVLGLCGLQRGYLAFLGLGDHGLPPGSAVWGAVGQPVTVPGHGAALPARDAGSERRRLPGHLTRCISSLCSSENHKKVSPFTVQ